MLGVVSIERIPQEWRIPIWLLTVSKENNENEKKYDKIAGNLIAFLAKIAIGNMENWHVFLLNL